mmetsp:Transcript_25349/g.29773  ORF Transcript_25349/g.29773 Transcript_25349/m.29773 type:complete len:90 (-) Transcript_25349:464-733(-)
MQILDQLAHGGKLMGEPLRGHFDLIQLILLLSIHLILHVYGSLMRLVHIEGIVARVVNVIERLALRLLLMLLLLLLMGEAALVLQKVRG